MRSEENIQPSAWDLSKDSFHFWLDHFQDYLSLITKYLPVLIGVHLVLYYIQDYTGHVIYHDLKDAEGIDLEAIFNNEVASYGYIAGLLAGLITTAITAAIAIEWHRIVIRGKDRMQRVNLLKPTGHEWDFIKLCYIIFFITSLASLFAFFASKLFPGAFALTIIFYIAFGFFMLKIFPYFPAKAIGLDGVSLSKAFSVSKGFVLKLVLTTIIWTLLFMLAAGAFSGLWSILASLVLPSTYPETFGAYEFIAQIFKAHIVNFCILWLVSMPMGVTIVSKIFILIMDQKEA